MLTSSLLAKELDCEHEKDILESRRRNVELKRSESDTAPTAPSLHVPKQVRYSNSQPEWTTLAGAA